MLSIRTHAVACFVVGQGHVPVGVEYRGPHPVYIFHDEAQAAMKKYADARQLLAYTVEPTETPRSSPNMNVQAQVERQIRRRW